jgi:SAM-dependent methyltransferase
MPPGLATAFDEVAADYDRYRPTYPDELVDHACRVAGIGPGDRVLELGCGTGQLTRSLAARGLEVTAVERGRQLISLAERNLQGRGLVEFVNAQFEDAQLPRVSFRAAFAAASFHWIDPDVSWEKAARTLAPDGTLALVQYCGLHAPGLDDQDALLSALARIAPDVAANWPAYRDLDAIAAGVQERRANVSEAWAWIGSQDVARPGAGRWFCDVEVATVPVAVEHTAEELNGIVRTASFYSGLAPERRRALEREHVAMHERLGRPIRMSMVAVLLTARRTTAL